MVYWYFCRLSEISARFTLQWKLLLFQNLLTNIIFCLTQTNFSPEHNFMHWAALKEYQNLSLSLSCKELMEFFREICTILKYQILQGNVCNGCESKEIFRKVWWVLVNYKKTGSQGWQNFIVQTGLERERWGFDIKCNNEAVCNTLILEYFLLPVTIGSGIS